MFCNFYCSNLLKFICMGLSSYTIDDKLSICSFLFPFQGHELTVRVLFRLYRESEQDQDFLISRTATSIYESFLVTVVCLCDLIHINFCNIVLVPYQ